MWLTECGAYVDAKERALQAEFEPLTDHLSSMIPHMSTDDARQYVNMMGCYVKVVAADKGRAWAAAWETGIGLYQQALKLYQKPASGEASRKGMGGACWRGLRV